MKRTLRLPDSNEAIEKQLAALPPAQHGLTILPLFAGERSTGWRADARAAITGLGANTSPIEILQAALESVALRFRNVYEIMEIALGAPREVVASGAAPCCDSPVWTQMMADTLAHADHAVRGARSDVARRGAARAGTARGDPTSPSAAVRRGDSADRRQTAPSIWPNCSASADSTEKYLRRASESQSPRAHSRFEDQASADGCGRRHDERQALSFPRRTGQHDRDQRASIRRTASRCSGCSGRGCRPA